MPIALSLRRWMTYKQSGDPDAHSLPLHWPWEQPIGSSGRGRPIRERTVTKNRRLQNETGPGSRGT